MGKNISDDNRYEHEVTRKRHGSCEAALVTRGLIQFAIKAVVKQAVLGMRSMHRKLHA